MYAYLLLSLSGTFIAWLEENFIRWTDFFSHTPQPCRVVPFALLCLTNPNRYANHDIIFFFLTFFYFLFFLFFSFVFFLHDVAGLFDRLLPPPHPGRMHWWCRLVLGRYWI